MPVLFTLGYQGHSIASLLEVLLAHGITTVIDVRERPYSRKPDFNQKRLIAHLASEGVGYLHLIELGTPKPIRDAVRHSKDYSAFFAAVTPLVETQEAALQTALVRVRTETCALLCYEGSVAECHRIVVAAALERRASGDLSIVHL